MGGKTKQNQRTKNNAQPSNSGRSAELLGSAIPPFVGFSAHSDLGMIPFAPGFGTTAENLPETFDSSISGQFQLVLRKMSKKDPVTKVKALQEFTELLTEAEMDVVKGILPLWPKFYHNLANDVDHRVREGAQNVQELIVTKCKKAVAPYLKQLTPVWIASQFDNYAPAASVAAASFQSVFAANKMQEVCLFCQQEIVDYAVRNITFHTASTLSSAKSCTPEEAEHKYQRVIACSLKMLSFFLEKTAENDISTSLEKIHGLLTHQKFWSFSKHRSTRIKSAWFELLYNVLQYTPEITADIKGQLIPLCFQNIDDSDPLIAPHVWGCILLLQNIYEDWHTLINFKKHVQSKLSSCLRNACNCNAEAVCPNLLPFLSKLTQDSVQEVSLDDFHKDFFKDLKEAITASKEISRSDCLALTSAHYECIRYILQRHNANPTEESPIPRYILDEMINDSITWACTNKSHASKYIFLHTSALVAYWEANAESKLYAEMLRGFWAAIEENISKSNLDEEYMDRIIELVNNLYWANPNLQSSKVKFSRCDDDDDVVDSGCCYKKKPKPTFVQKELRKLVVQLVRRCLDNLSNNKELPYEGYMRTLTKLYSDAKFYAEISGENDMEVTLNRLADHLRATLEPSEVLVETVFEILSYMEKEKKLKFIDKLLETKKPALQQCLLQRLLSYPMCIEPEVRVMLSQAHVIEIILQTANEVISNNSKEKFNLLHKCFFQTDSGEILVNQQTVDGILEIMSSPLVSPKEYEDMLDPCGSFIAEIMPVVCSNNSSEKAQKDTFLKLFKFTVDQNKSDFLSEDTLWEIITSWQDALSSRDIILDEPLLEKCYDIISSRLSNDINIEEVDRVSYLVGKLILCSIEYIGEEDRHHHIDSYVEALLKPSNEMFKADYEKVANFCTFLEVMRAGLTVTQLPIDAGKDINFNMFFRRNFLNLYILNKLVFTLNKDRIMILATESSITKEEDDSCEDYFDETILKRWTEKLYDLMVYFVKIAAIADSLVANCPKIPKDTTKFMTEMTKDVLSSLRDIAEKDVLQIKDRLLKDAAFNDVAAVRGLSMLKVIPQYAQFQESSLILLQEDLTDYFITRESLGSYVNMLQFMLPNLTDKVITSDNPLLRRDTDIWQKCAIFRCLIANNFNAATNEISDKKIIAQALNYITEVSEKQKQTNKEAFLCNTDISQQDFVVVTRVVEYINLLRDVLSKFPYELTLKNWDVIRFLLSSWILSVSKSVENYTNSSVAIFLNAVYKLFGELVLFIKDEKTKSSTEVLTKMIDEWENLFAPEVNFVLFNSFYKLVSLNVTDYHYSSCVSTFKEIAQSIQCLDYSHIYKSCKTGKKISLDDLTKFLLNNTSSPVHSLRIISANALTQLAPFFITADKEILEKTADTMDTTTKETISNWHFMSKFKDYMEKHQTAILKYLEEFSFKMTELVGLKPIDSEDATPYLVLWECVMDICTKAPVELRSVYTSWLTENKFDEKFLDFLFRAMPVEILKNHDSKLMTNELFRPLPDQPIQYEKLPVEKYVCHLYSAALSKLPAIVRKWWNSSHSRQKVFVDKLTTNFVSSLICYNELETIARIEMTDKMQVTVHTSTREVNAVYFIDEARMELIITLAPNHPLGGVKVESGKQIGGRASSRNIAMQLTIFLTHQNGSILDGLSLWKKNLDKKFEGVEECYVCYTVIHQDTCQLPKLTCKTCKKKFHSPCLYKWFTTSSKSTCPICRNIF